MQKPVNELGKSYVDFMRCNVDQLRQKITDELYTLAAFEVSGWLGLCLDSQYLHTVHSYGKVPRVLTSAYKLNLPSKALQVLIFALWSLQV